MSPMSPARPPGRTLAAVVLALGLTLGPTTGALDSPASVAPGPRTAAAQEAQEAVREAPAPGPPAAADAQGAAGRRGGAPLSKEWAADVLAQAGVGLLRGSRTGSRGSSAASSAATRGTS